MRFMEKNLLLCIETSTEMCSVAIYDVEKEVMEGEKSLVEARMQSAMLVPMIDALFAETSHTIDECCAVAVSEGPGSYTGLRVGVSTAKGLCFGLKVPLIAVSTMDILCCQAQTSDGGDIVSGGDAAYTGAKYIVPMIDARRMEVYQAVYKSDGERISQISPKILDSASYSDFLSEAHVLFVGNGCMKFKDVLKEGNAFFLPVNPAASAMALKAAKKFASKEFEDVAYFEPFYLKEFVAGVTKKSVLKTDI